MYNVQRIALTDDLRQKLNATESTLQPDYGDVYDLTLYKSARIDAATLINMTVTYNPDRRLMRLFYRLPTTTGMRMHYLGELCIGPRMPVVDRCWEDKNIKERNPDFLALFSTSLLRQMRNDAIADVLSRY